MEDAIVIENVSKRYRLGEFGGLSFWETLRGWGSEVISGRSHGDDPRDFWALRDVSLKIEQGETVGVVGANGAGKSTLLKIISRITAPSAGVVSLRGRVGSLLEVGTGFHQDLSGRDNVYLNGAILGMNRREVRQKFDAIVAFAELEKFIDTPVKRYSSGMYVRLAFAVAAFLEPEILIFDEVLSVGDQGFQNKCMERIEELLKDGRTLLFVSHSMQSMMRACSRAVELQNGRIVFDGPAEQAARRYVSDVQKVQPCSMREWPDTEEAPGDETARLLGIRALDPEGHPVSRLPCTSGMRLEVTYRILKQGTMPQIPVFHIYEASSIPLFTTLDTNPQTRTQVKKPGIYRSSAVIPPEIFAPGQIVVSVVCASLPEGTVHFSEQKSLLLEIGDVSGEGTLRGDFKGRYPGVLRPRMAWETTKL